jgi:hypothetical protein
MKRQVGGDKRSNHLQTMSRVIRSVMEATPPSPRTHHAPEKEGTDCIKCLNLLDLNGRGDPI